MSKIYAIGGFNGKQRLRTIEEYDIARNEWQVMEVTLPVGLTNSSALAINNKRILIVGGGSVHKFGGVLPQVDPGGGPGQTGNSEAGGHAQRAGPAQQTGSV